MRYVIMFSFVALSLNLLAQVTGAKRDTTKVLTKTDTTLTDTLKKNSTTITGLSGKIEYRAEDSIRFSVDQNIIFLYGKARISYEEMELAADYIKLDQKNKMLFASGLNDKYHRYRGRPIFKQGSEPAITTDSLVFNMNTKKGKTYGSFSEVEGGYISAAQSKKNPYNEISFKNGIYSTCKSLLPKSKLSAAQPIWKLKIFPSRQVFPLGFFQKQIKGLRAFAFLHLVKTVRLDSLSETLDGTLGLMTIGMQRF